MPWSAESQAWDFLSNPLLMNEGSFLHTQYLSPAVLRVRTGSGAGSEPKGQSPCFQGMYELIGRDENQCMPGDNKC